MKENITKKNDTKKNEKSKHYKEKYASYHTEGHTNTKKNDAKKNDVKKSENKKFNEKKTTSKKPQQKTFRPEIKEEKRENILGDCNLARKCGGCQYQGQAYDKQLKMKQDNVRGLVGEFCKVEPIIGMKDPFHYRNKVNAAFDITSRGQIISGVYKEGTHEVINVDECQIENENADAIIRDIRGMLKSFRIKTYDADTGFGLLRHVMVRTGYATGQVMVVIVTGSPILPSKNNFVKAILKLHPEITAIVQNINERKTSMVLGNRNITLYGKGYIEDVLCGLRFKLSPSSFYQVNPIQTEVLYNKAMEYAGLGGREWVIDAYCGIGTIGMVASKRAKKVTGVELNKMAVKDAVMNAKNNGVKNITFYNQDAGEFMAELAERKERVDVLFMDPPRAGSDETFLRSACHLGPKKIVYISCNPVTLARDLDYLTECGYKAVKCQPIDMFPFTEHVETIVALHRINS